MGRLVAGILAGFSGRVGPVSGSSWKGIGYMKTRPASVAVSQSAGSVIARTKWPTLTQLGSILLASIVKPLWDRFAQRESGYNVFIRDNYAAIDDDGVIIGLNVVISKGTLDNVTDLVITVDASEQSITIGWTDNSGTGNAISTDQLYVAWFNPITEAWGSIGQAATRNAAISTLDPGFTLVAAQHLFVYTAWRRADGSLVSNGTAADKTIIA